MLEQKVVIRKIRADQQDIYPTFHSRNIPNISEIVPHLPESIYVLAKNTMHKYLRRFRME